MLGFGVLGTIILGTEVSSVSATVTLTGAAATAVAASIIPQIAPGGFGGVNGTGAVQGFGISASDTDASTFGTGAVAAFAISESVAINGVNSTTAVQGLGIQETVNFGSVFGSGAVAAFGIKDSVSLTGINGSGAAQSLAIIETVGFFATFATTAVAAMTPNPAKTLAGANGSAVVQPVTVLEPIALAAVFGTGAANAVSAGAVQNANLTGINATGSAQAVSIIIGPTVTAVFGTGATGSITSNEAITLTGINASGQSGSLVAVNTSALVGVNGTSAASSFAIITINVPITGANATGEFGTFLVPVNFRDTFASGVATAIIPEIDFAITGTSASGAIQNLVGVNPAPNAIGISATADPGQFVWQIPFTLASTSAAAATDNFVVDPSAQISGIASQGSAVAVIPTDGIAINGVFASGAASGPSSFEIDIPLPSVFATSAASVQFGPNSFFNGVAAFSASDGFGIEIDPVYGGVVATAATGGIIANAVVPLSTGPVNGFAGSIAIENDLIPTSSAAAAGAAQSVGEVSSISSAQAAATGVAALSIAITTNLDGVQAQTLSQSIAKFEDVEITGTGGVAIGVAFSILVSLLADDAGVASAAARGAASSAFVADTTQPIPSAFSSGAGNPIIPSDATALLGMVSTAQAQNFLPPGGFPIFGAASGGVAAAISLPQENIDIGIGNVNAVGSAGEVARADLLIGANATGNSAPITLIDLGQSPLLIGASAQGSAQNLLILANLTGIAASGVSSGLLPERILASAIATAESGQIIFVSPLLIGVSAIGGIDVVVVAAVSFDVNAATNIHGMSAFAIKFGSGGTVSIVGGASKNLPVS